MPGAELFPEDPPAWAAPPPAPELPPTVEIRTSTRRRKTVAAHWEGDTIVVVVPHRLSKKDRQACADDLTARLVESRARLRPTDAGLAERAGELARRYLGDAVAPTAVTWSSRQQHRWASCSPAEGTIRVSDRLKDVPAWVLDTVLLHELAHLVHPDHGPAFQALANRHPRAGDAAMFLAGYAVGLDRA